MHLQSGKQMWRGLGGARTTVIPWEQSIHTTDPYTGGGSNEPSREMGHVADRVLIEPYESGVYRCVLYT